MINNVIKYTDQINSYFSQIFFSYLTLPSTLYMGKIAVTDKIRMQMWHECLNASVTVWLPMVVTSGTCSNSVYLQVCILIPCLSSRHQKTALFGATHILPKTKKGWKR